MNNILLKDTSSENFRNYILEISFPIDERPDEKSLRNRDYTLFHEITIFDTENPIGIINYWNFDEFIYIEHFAILPDARNKGIGKFAMNKFIEKFKPKLIILEAEPATDELSTRRINFYKRLGFLENTYNYTQPAYRIEGNCIDLKILSTTLLGKEQFSYFTEKIKKYVYNC